MMPSPTATWLSLLLKTRQVLHVHVEQPRSGFVNRLNHIRAGARCVTDIDAASHARVHILYCLQHIQRRGPQLIFRPMIVDGEPDVVFLHELFNAGKHCRSRAAGDDHGNAGPLAVFKLAANIIIIIFGK